MNSVIMKISGNASEKERKREYNIHKNITNILKLKLYISRFPANHFISRFKYLTNLLNWKIILILPMYFLLK